RLASADVLEKAVTEIARSVSGVLSHGAAIALASWEYGETSWAGVSLGNEYDSARLSRLMQETDLSRYRDDIEHLLLSESPTAVRAEDCPWMVGETGDRFRQLGIAGKLVIPMRSRGRAPGLLFLLTSDDPHSFPSDVVETAELVASRIGDEIERRKMSGNRAALLRASEGMNRHTDLDTLVPLIARELNEIIPYDSLYIGELDRDRDVTHPLYFVNPLGHLVDDVELASNDGLSGYVMRTQVPILDNQAHLHPATVYASPSETAYFESHGESVMAAPLTAENDVVGILFVGRTGEHRFHTSDFETFKLFAGLSASAIHRATLIRRNQAIYRASVEVLAAVVDAHDPSTLRHSRNVAYYARACAELLRLDGDQIEQVEMAGLLHDIGKLALSDELLERTGGTGTFEDGPVGGHPEHAAEILSRHPVLATLAPLVRHQHECYDGSGFPDRLASECIPLGARIIGVVDIFDWTVASQALNHQNAVEEALETLEEGAGTLFDPEITDVFIRGIRTGRIDPTASRVRTLADDALQTIADLAQRDPHEFRTG
ncbi:MAG: HD domain-containing phosphohydrolase, partial [Chloroflexota bacterium]